MFSRLARGMALAVVKELPAHTIKLYFIYLKDLFMAMNVLPAFIYVHHVHSWCQWNSKGGTGSREVELQRVVRLPCGFWELNLHLLQEQQELWNTKPSLSFRLLFSRMFTCDSMWVWARKWSCERGCPAVLLPVDWGVRQLGVIWHGRWDESVCS